MNTRRPQVLILGIGNLLLSDEGLGVHVINLLQDRYEFPPNVTLYDGGTGGLSLLSQIYEQDYLFIIDAILIGEKPGTVIRFSYNSIPDTYQKKNTAHGIDILDVLAAAQITNNLPKTTIIGMQPADISTPNLELTPIVSSNIESLIQTLIRHLEDIGIRPQEKPKSPGEIHMS